MMFCMAGSVTKEDEATFMGEGFAESECIVHKNEKSNPYHERKLVYFSVLTHCSDFLN